MVKGLLGSSAVDSGIDKGVGTAAPGEPAPFDCIAWFAFNTMQDFEGAFGANAETIMADIPNYTDAEPIVQISEIQ